MKSKRDKTFENESQLFQKYPNLAQLCSESFSGKSPLDNKERKWLEVMKLRQDLLATEFMGGKTFGSLVRRYYRSAFPTTPRVAIEA